MALQTKVLWVEDFDTNADQAQVLQQASATGATILCIRTISTKLAGLIPGLKVKGFKVYGWRYPQTEDRGVANNSDSNPPNNSYAPKEAAYVINTLIKAGLDGYIMDIESDNDKKKPQPWRDWDRKDIDLTSLATNYANALRTAANNCGRPFVLGFTSHANAFNIYPGTPWKPFIDVSDVMLPQSYWRYLDGATKTPENGNTPASAMDISYADYSAWGKKIIPIGGEMSCCLPGEMKAFGALLAAKGITEGHFYTSTDHIDPGVLAEIKAL
jgi:hypothetical protein